MVSASRTPPDPPSIFLAARVLHRFSGGRLAPMRFRLLVPAVLCLCGVGLVRGQNEEGETPEPIRVLIVSGGANHDYAERARILAAGIRQRSSRVLEFRTVVQGEGRSDLAFPIFEESEWTGEHDVVIHDYCLTRVNDPQVVDKVLAPHRAGKAALLLHATCLSFPGAGETWREFVGATVLGQDSTEPFTVGWKAPTDAIATGLAALPVPGGELYRIEGLASGTKAIGEAEGKGGAMQTVAWTHRYSDSSAPVFATTLGADTATFLDPVFLDLVTRGLLWSVDELQDDAFRKIEPEDSLPGFAPRRPERFQIRLGAGTGTRPSAQASTSNVADGHLAGFAVDGNPDSFWEAGEAGPASLQLVWPEENRVEALAIQWRDEAPADFFVESGLGPMKWSRIDGVKTVAKDGTMLLAMPEASMATRIRITVPSTPAGHVVGIREIAVYPALESVPATLLLERPLPEGLRATGEGSTARNIRIAPDWILEDLGELPAGFELSEAAESADGGLYLVGNSSGSSENSILFARPGSEGDFRFFPFLDRIGHEGSMTWDGEWVRIVNDGRITGFRDTNGDGVADERFHQGLLVRGDGSSVLRKMRAAPDGWCLAMERPSSEERTTRAFDRIVRFPIEGGEVATVWESARPLSDFSVDRFGRTYVLEAEGEWRLLPAVAGPVNEGDAVTWIAPEKKVEGRWGVDRLVREGEIGVEWISGDEPAFRIVADFGDYPVMLPTNPDSPYVFAKLPDGWRHYRLLHHEATRRHGIDLDRVPDDELIDLLADQSSAVRLEAGFEFFRRRRDRTSDTFLRLAQPGTDEYRAALAVIAQVPGKDAFGAIAREVEERGNPYAIRLLGDRSEAKNHPVFAAVTTETKPASSAALLGAIQRSETDVPGLARLAFSFAAHSDPELSSSARNFLVARDRWDLCLQVLDDPKSEVMHRTAFAILSESTDPAIVGEIIQRVKETRDPGFRRLGFETLCRIHVRIRAVGSDPGLSPIEVFLNESLRNPRFDRVYLLDRMLHHDIPLGDSSVLAELGESDLSLEPAIVPLLVRREGVPSSALQWIERIREDDSRDPGLRVQAAALAVREAGLPLRSRFEIAAEGFALDVEKESHDALVDSWSATAFDGEALSYLLGRTNRSVSAERFAAWTGAFAALAQNPDGQEELKTKASSVAASANSDLRELLLAAAALGFEDSGPYVAAAAASTDPELRQVAIDTARSLGLDPATGGALGSAIGSVGLEEAARMVAEAADSADEEAGWAVFQRERCANCHNIHGEGISFGPDIVAAAGTLSLDQFVGALLAPRVGRTEGYGSRVFEWETGLRLRGLVEERSDTMVTMRDAGANLLELPIERIRWEWPEDVSPTHRDFGASLAPVELASLRAFLRKVGGY